MMHTATVIDPKEYKNKRYTQRPFRLITSKYLPIKEYGAEVQDVSFF
jgi:hypothetical protein